MFDPLDFDALSFDTSAVVPPSLPVIVLGRLGLHIERPFVGQEDAPIWADDEDILMML